MTLIQRILTAAILTLSLATVSLGGTITGSRTGATGARVGTITGSRTGTITGSRAGTITGSRVGTISGSGAAIPAPSTDSGVADSTKELVSRVLTLLIQLGW